MLHHAKKVHPKSAVGAHTDESENSVPLCANPTQQCMEEPTLSTEDSFPGFCFDHEVSDEDNENHCVTSDGDWNSNTDGTSCGEATLHPFCTVGTRVVKEFEGEWHRGTVTEFCHINGWHRIVYEDGTVDDLTADEMESDCVILRYPDQRMMEREDSSVKHMTAASRRFFNNDLRCRMTGEKAGDLALKGLVMQSHLGQTDFDIHNPHFTRAAVGYATKMAKLAVRLTRDTTELMLSAFDDHRKMMEERQAFVVSGIVDGLSWPSAAYNTSTFRRHYTDGKLAILPNLPTPRVREVGRVAHVSVIDVMQNALAIGLPTGPIHYLWHLVGSRELLKTHTPDPPNQLGGRQVRLITTHLSNSPAAHKILERARHVCPHINPQHVYPLKHWSDDYESNHCKTDVDSNVHKESISFLPPTKADPRWGDVCYTYPLSVGPKNKSASSFKVVGQLLNDEYSRLSCAGYSTPMMLYARNESVEAGEFTRVPVYAEIMISSQDQPERRKANCLLAGNSLSHPRFGHRIKFKEIMGLLPSCKDCRHCLENRLPIPSCRECYHWTPEEAMKDTRISYPSLKKTVKEVHHGLQFGEISATDARKSLKEACINDSYAKEVVMRGLQAGQLQACKNESTRGYKMDEELLRCYASHPHLFEVAEFPDPWDRSHWELEKQIDAPMHLLFLGITKSVMMFMVGMLSARNLKSNFTRHMKGRLEGLSNLAHSWCDVKPYRDSDVFGGWLSSNFLAAARLLPWIYAGLDFAEEEEYVEPETPLRRWTKVEKQDWLVAHGAPKSGKADELEQRIRDLKRRPGGPPPLAKARGPTNDEMKRTVTGAASMISRLMGARSDQGHIESQMRHIRLFLDYFEDCDRKRRGDSGRGEALFSVDEIEMEASPDQPTTSEKEISDSDTPEKNCYESKLPTWLSKYNFLCLPNLPGTVAEFGPLRELWEGGWSGEKGITDSKHATTRAGSSDGNWAKNQMEHEQRIGAMRRMEQEEQRQEVEEGEAEDDLAECERPTTVTRNEANSYDYDYHVLEDLEKGKPLSSTWCDCASGGFCCYVKDTAVGKGKEVLLKPSNDAKNSALGFQYFGVTAIVQERHHCDADRNRRAIPRRNTPEHLLPLVSPTTIPTLFLPWPVKGHQEYAVISNEWSVFTSTGRFEMYTIPGLVYGELENEPDPLNLR